MWMSLVVGLATAYAAPCDAAALGAAVDAATPATVARAWAALAECDGEAAKTRAGKAFETALPGSDAHDALLKAIDLGLAEPARAWIRRSPSDERSKAIGFLGGQCASHPAVPTFLVGTHAAIGPDYWAERWHRGLADCRTPEVTAFLDGALRGDEVGIEKAIDRAMFFSLLEVYARNQGAAALPTLVRFAQELEDESEITYVISAFGNAAGVGTAAGVDYATAREAVKGLQQLGPELPARAVDHARGILLALGDEQAADAYAKYRWPAAFRNGDYAYRYTVFAVETSTCKNGKKQAIAHHADLTEPGMLWPDQVADLLQEKLAFEWGLDGGNLCAGTWEVTWRFPEEPFETDEAQEAWTAEQTTAFQAATVGVSKTQIRAHDDLGL